MGFDCLQVHIVPAVDPRGQQARACEQDEAYGEGQEEGTPPVRAWARLGTGGHVEDGMGTTWNVVVHDKWLLGSLLV